MSITDDHDALVSQPRVYPGWEDHENQRTALLLPEGQSESQDPHVDLQETSLEEFVAVDVPSDFEPPQMPQRPRRRRPRLTWHIRLFVLRACLVTCVVLSCAVMFGLFFWSVYVIIDSWDKSCDLKYWLSGCLLLTTCIIFRNPLWTFTHRYFCLWRPEPNAQEPARIRALYWLAPLVAFFSLFECVEAVEKSSKQPHCIANARELCDWANFLSPYGAICFQFAWCVHRIAHMKLVSLSGANARIHWPRPADPTIITRIQAVVVDSATEQCCICLQDYDADPSAKVTPCCANNFHEECLRRWLAQHRTCPLCRADVQDVLDGVM